MNHRKSTGMDLDASIALLAVSFLFANSGGDLSSEDPFGPYHAAYSFFPWLLQWGAIALFLGYLSRRFPQQCEWLSPRLVLP